jgi:hypothetical protein
MKAHVFPLLICLGLTACSDIIETDLDGFGVVLLTPVDGTISTSNVIAFRWEAVPHATEYRFEVAMPDFNQPQQIVADSVLGSPQIDLPLAPGSYTWRVKARNASSSTDYYSRTLTIMGSDSLDNLLPVLVSPPVSSITAVDPVVFKWQPLNGAADYRFELRQGGQTGPLLQAQIVEGTQISIPSIVEGTYTWGVQGHNEASSSLFNYRPLTIDRTPPGVPLLLAPPIAATIPNTGFTFQWQSGSDPSSTTDSLFVMDGNSVMVRALPVSGNAHPDSLGIGSFQWYVRTTDAAGNGSSSVPRNLTVQ